MAKVSLIMSVYNEPVIWVKESVDSILAQTFKDFEFIIVCDNPVNYEVIQYLKGLPLKDDRIRVCFNSQNIGLTKSLNKAISLSSNTEYIARMDADDIAYNKKLEKQIEFLENNKRIGVCGTCVEFFGAKHGIQTYPLTTSDVYLFIDNCFAHPTVVIRRSVLHNRYYDEKFQYSQDFALWNRLYSEGVLFYNIPEVLLKYRVSSQQIMNSKGCTQKKFSRINRRNALNIYCKKNDIKYSLPDGPIKMKDIYQLTCLLSLNKEQKKKFIYFLLLSNDECLLKKISCMIKNVNILNFSQIVRVIFHHIKKTDLAKF